MKEFIYKLLDIVSGFKRQELREWCILDTFDMFSPQYDQPQKGSTEKKWFEENSMEQI